MMMDPQDEKFLKAILEAERPNILKDVHSLKVISCNNTGVGRLYEFFVPGNMNNQLAPETIGRSFAATSSSFDGDILFLVGLKNGKLECFEMWANEVDDFPASLSGFTLRKIGS